MDTEAQLNVMPIEIYKKNKSVQWEESEIIIIKAFGGFTMSVNKKMYINSSINK